MKFVQRSVFAALVFAVIFALHQIAAVTFGLHRWEFPKAGDWATWFGAAGTIAAFCVTIHIARTETRRREKQEVALARIAAAKLWILIPGVQEMVEMTQKLLVNQPLDQQQRDWANLGKALGAIELWSDEDLVRLANSSQFAGGQLALAGAELRSCARSLTSVAITYLLLTQEGRFKFDRDIRTRLQRVQIYLRAALDECDKILSEMLA